MPLRLLVIGKRDTPLRLVW